VLIILTLQGCASVISKGTLQDADLNVTFEQLAGNPDAYIGKTVVFGGTVIRTENLTDKTKIFILQRPLEFRDKPTVKDLTKGRFILSTPDFLDPEIYQPGRKVTAAGTVKGKESHPLDGIEYTYPVIEKKELYLWPIEDLQQETPRFFFGFGFHKGL
jgi:outer membrane lipoprotein